MNLALRCVGISLFAIATTLTLQVSASRAQDAEAEAKAQDVAREDIPILEREPYDIIILDSSNNDAKLEVRTLDFPNRVVPNNRPGAEKLRFNLIDDDKNTYEVAWRHIVDIRLFEQMILEKAIELTRQKNFDEAYRFFEYLIINYPKMQNLREEYNLFLYQDATLQFDQKNHANALAVFEELGKRDASFRPGSNDPSVDERIAEILDLIIGEQVRERDYLFARELMRRVTVKHGERQSEVVNRWTTAIKADAEAHRENARRFFDEGNGRKAHEEIRRMMNILPDLEGGIELANQITEKYPLVLVGIDQPARDYDPQSIHDWASRRVGRMTYRQIVEFEGQGQDGGQYRFPYGRIEYGEDGKSFTFQIGTFGPEPGLPAIDAYQISTRILDRALEHSLEYSPAWRRLLSSVEIEDSDRIRVNLTQAHVLPESILQIPLTTQALPDEVLPFNGFYAPHPSNEAGSSFKVNPVYGDQAGVLHPEVVELTFSRSEDAVNAIRRGDIDIIDRVFPGDLRQLRSTPGVTVERYAVPTVHMLVPNKRTEHMKDRTFRLALMMGIDRAGIMRNSLLGGMAEPGFEVVSGPFPIGFNDSDPINYGYNFRIEPLTYDWRLAGTMILLAENALKAMLERIEKKLPPRPTLVLAHPSGDLPSIACQEIARQWKLIGIECELRELPAGKVWPDDDDYDLVYLQVAMQEPLIQARTLLAEDGIVKSDNSSVDLALRQLDVANSWPAARRRLNELHTFVQNEAVVIPLYQTVDYFAYRETVRGVGRKLTSLYDNVQNWRVMAGQQNDVATQ